MTQLLPLRSYHWQFDHTLYPDLYLLRQITEAEVQSGCLDLLRAMHIQACAVDAGGAKIRGSAYRALKAAGVPNAGYIVQGGAGASIAGLVDIIGTLPGGRSLYIEVKAPAWYRLNKQNQMRQSREAGKPSDKQLAFMDSMADCGALVGVVWSIGDLEDILQYAQNVPCYSNGEHLMQERTA